MRIPAHVVLALLVSVAGCGGEEPSGPPPGPSLAQQLHQRLIADPTDVATRLELANHYYDTSRQQLAVPLYLQVLEVRPDDPDIRTDLGTCYNVLGQLEKARAEFERVVREHPEHVNSVFNLAVVEAREGHFLRAAELWDKAAAMTPDERVVARASQLAAEARQKAQAGAPGGEKR